MLQHSIIKTTTKKLAFKLYTQHIIQQINFSMNNEKNNNDKCCFSYFNN